MRSAPFLLAILLIAAPAWGQESPAPPAAAPAPSGPRVVIATAMGDITLALDPARAPATVKNFLRYAKEGHYTGTVVYRVVPGFLIQAGSWDAQGHGRPGHKGIALESDNGLANVRGAVAMAHGDDPLSTMAEFFIDLADNPSLDRHPGDPPNSGFTVFGRVVAGMDVVDAIAKVPLGDNGPMKGQAPVEPIAITKVTILPAPAP
ncbi:MAG TPA: peptidylprolyl isomerase [Rhizomicrobium sp.]